MKEFLEEENFEEKDSSQVDIKAPQKIRDKISKLLALSMSDNENEAALALERALKLMNKHNITEDEVNGQKMK